MRRYRKKRIKTKFLKNVRHIFRKIRIKTAIFYRRRTKKRFSRRLRKIIKIQRRRKVRKMRLFSRNNKMRFFSRNNKKNKKVNAAKFKKTTKNLVKRNKPFLLRNASQDWLKSRRTKRSFKYLYYKQKVLLKEKENTIKTENIALPFENNKVSLLEIELLKSKQQQSPIFDKEKTLEQQLDDVANDPTNPNTQLKDSDKKKSTDILDQKYEAVSKLDIENKTISHGSVWSLVKKKKTYKRHKLKLKQRKKKKKKKLRLKRKLAIRKLQNLKDKIPPILLPTKKRSKKKKAKRHI